MNRNTSEEHNTSITADQLSTALSMRTKLGHLLLLFGASAMSIVVAALLLTEQGLPGRTQISFAVMLVIGLVWAWHAVQVLSRRRTLLAMHRVTAAKMGIVFSVTFTLGALWIGLIADIPAALWAAGCGFILILAAIIFYMKATKRLTELKKARSNIEAELAETGST